MGSTVLRLTSAFACTKAGIQAVARLEISGGFPTLDLSGEQLVKLVLSHDSDL